MKKLLILTAVLFCMAATASAQHNQNITMPEKPQRAKYVDYSVLRTGYWVAAQAGAFYGSQNTFVGQFDLTMGYRFSEFLKVGVGVAPRIGLPSIPVYADVRGNFISQEDTMFALCWSADIGYAFNQGGIYVSPGIGARFGGLRHNLLIGINYILQGQPSPADALHLVGLRIGYEF